MNTLNKNMELAKLVTDKQIIVLADMAVETLEESNPAIAAVLHEITLRYMIVMAEKEEEKYNEVAMNTKELIKLSVTDMLAAGFSFSIHDVIRYARDAVNNRAIHLDDRNRVFVAEFGGYTYELEYDADLKAVVVDILGEFDLSVDTTGGFRLYSAKAEDQDGFFSAPTTKDNALLAGGNSIDHKVDQTVNFQKPANVVSVEGFLERYATHGNSCTVKQVQSGIKRGNNYVSIPGEDIRAVAESLGYTVGDGANDVARISK